MVFSDATEWLHISRSQWWYFTMIPPCIVSHSSSSNNLTLLSVSPVLSGGGAAAVMNGGRAPAKGQSIKLAYSELPFNSCNATIYYARWWVKHEAKMNGRGFSGLMCAINLFQKREEEILFRRLTEKEREEEKQKYLCARVLNLMTSLNHFTVLMKWIVRYEICPQAATIQSQMEKTRSNRRQSK